MRRQAMGKRSEPRFHPDGMRGTLGLGVYAELGETLAVIKTQFESAIQADARLNPREEPPNQAFAQADRASLPIRQISAELGSVLLNTLGLAATIEWYLHEFQKCTGIDHEFRIDNPLGTGLDEDCATAMFHVFHETLSNIAHHARAKHIAITISITRQAAAMMVHDDGIGIADAPGRRSVSGGLARISGYASSLEGVCSVAGVTGQGTTLRVSLPLAGAGGGMRESIDMAQ